MTCVERVLTVSAKGNELVGLVGISARKIMKENGLL